MSSRDRCHSLFESIILWIHPESDETMRSITVFVSNRYARWWNYFKKKLYQMYPETYITDEKWQRNEYK